jgi:hypothetical protein
MPTAKFKAMVHFIIHECGDPARLGAVKLNKICWYSDVICYKANGVSVSGERYVKRQMGPVPHGILVTLRELEREKSIAISESNLGRATRRDFMSLREPDQTLLSPAETEIIRDVLKAICDGHTAGSISELTHDQIWDAAALGEDIPMFATLAASPGPVGDDKTAWADSIVAEIEEAKQQAA